VRLVISEPGRHRRSLRLPAGQAVPFKVVSMPALGGALTPGGPIQTAVFTVKNENSGSQNLSGVLVEVANADGSVWASVSGC
jgi:hypothetical protein